MTVTYIALPCPKCSKEIEVKYDPGYITKDRVGGYILANWSCWNCGRPYRELFADETGTITNAALREKRPSAMMIVLPAASIDWVAAPRLKLLL